MNVKDNLKELSTYLYIFEYIGEKPRTFDEVKNYIKECNKSNSTRARHNEFISEMKSDLLCKKEDRICIKIENARTLVESIHKKKMKGD